MSRGPLGRRASRVPVAIAVLTAGVLVAVAVVPERLGLAGLPGPAHVVALRGLVGALLAAVGLGLGLLAVVLRRAGGGARPSAVLPRAAAVVATVAVIALLGAGTEGAMLAARGVGGLSGSGPAGEVRPGDVVVLVQNTMATLTSEQLASEIIDRRAHIVVLPETSETTAVHTAALVRSRSGRDLQVLAHAAGSSAISSTALLVDRTLGALELTEVLPGIQGSFVATGASPSMVITAVHSTAPTGRRLDGWRTSTRAAVATCGTSSIVAGDVNATLDHPALRDLGGCIDAAATTGTAGVATWPVNLPRAFGAPIDHVLLDPRVWQVVRTAVLDPPSGTDHRAVEAVLGPVGG